MFDYHAANDETIIARSHDGDDAATDFLLEKYKPLVKKKARTLFLIGGDNDDLIQEGMIALYKAIRAFRADRESSFVHYASLCIDNQLYNVIKGANRLKNSPLNTYVSLYSPLNSDTENNSRETLADTLQPSELINPEDIVIHIETHLSKFEKEVVTLYLDGNDYQQIAVVLGKSPKSIDNALQRIRGKLLKIR